MVNWNNGLSLKITDKTSEALTKQIFEFYESITRPPNVDDLLPSNENNGEISHENYILRLDFFCSIGFCCACYMPNVCSSSMNRHILEILQSKQYGDIWGPVYQRIKARCT